MLSINVLPNILALFLSKIMSVTVWNHDREIANDEQRQKKRDPVFGSIDAAFLCRFT